MSNQKCILDLLHLFRDRFFFNFGFSISDLHLTAETIKENVAIFPFKLCSISLRFVEGRYGELTRLHINLDLSWNRNSCHLKAELEHVLKFISNQPV